MWYGPTYISITTSIPRQSCSQDIKINQTSKVTWSSFLSRHMLITAFPEIKLDEPSTFVNTPRKSNNFKSPCVLFSGFFCCLYANFVPNWASSSFLHDFLNWETFDSQTSKLLTFSSPRVSHSWCLRLRLIQSLWSSHARSTLRSISSRTISNI